MIVPIRMLGEEKATCSLVRKKHGTCTSTSNFDVGNVHMYVDVGTMLNTAAQPTP